MELYIHIPFCKKKCQYCDFVSAPGSVNEIEKYIESLKKEIVLSGKKFKGSRINTVYIGGGTPSLLSEDNISEIVKALKSSFDFSGVTEFTIESNPESISEEKLKLYKDIGINRLSVGVQSLNDENLKEIGRIHDSKTALEKLKLASEYFDNLSCDLIIGLPFDSRESVKNEIDTVAPYLSHISMYELIIEDGTVLKDRVDRNEVVLPSDDETEELFETARAAASENGFERYEVSNFARNGRISEHNYGYWTREEYLGLGLNSASLIGNVRFSNFSSMDKYTESVSGADSFDKIRRENVIKLSKKDIKDEEIMLGLRTMRGVRKEIIEKRISERLRPFFTEKDGYIALTEHGTSVMNPILIELLEM
ncbi:MAG: radical SAM family heme chaperone HemW [Clostridia bacterium]|nr:radical SAM family heme chaperone HemW [Clostridia bacterium]